MTVAYIPVSFGFGTTVRCLAVAEELRRRGVAGTFLAGAAVQEMIRRHGFEARTIPDIRIRPERPEWPARQLFAQEDAPGFLRRQRDSLTWHLREIGAELVVYSNSLSAAYAAARLGLPSISIFSPSILGIPSLALAVPMIRAWLLTQILRFQTPGGRAVTSAFLGTRGFIPSIPPLIEWPWLTPPGLLWRRSAVAPIGALLPQSVDCLPPAGVLREELGVTRRPFIYATVGGAIFNLDLIDTVARAIRQAGGAGLVSGGRVVTAEVAERLSGGGVRVVPFLPDDLRAIRAADALVWHGGHQTMLEAVAAGTPAVGLPYQLDQFANVASLVRSGAARQLSPRHLAAEPLAAAITAVVEDPSYRCQMERLQQINAAYPGAAGVADVARQLIGRSAVVG